MRNNSQGKKQDVEDHRRSVKFSKNKTSITACNDSLNAKTLNVNFVCTTCGKCVLKEKHDMRVLKSVNIVHSRTKMPIDMPVSTRQPKRIVKQSAAKTLNKTAASETNQKPRNITRKLYERVSVPLCQILHFLLILLQLVEIFLFIIDSGCSKHMTGNLKLLINFMEKFLGTVKFRNDQIAPILGYGDQSRAYRVFNKRTRVIVETIHVNFDELPQMASDHVSSDPGPECQRTALEHDRLSPGLQCQDNVTQADKTVTTLNELDLLFSLMFNELLNGSSQVVSKSSAVTTADAPNQRQQQNTTPLNTFSTPDPTCQVPPHAPTVASTENMNQAEIVEEIAQVENDEFINIFYTPVQDRGETSSRHVDSSNMHTFYQHHPSKHHWTKDHPLEQVIGNPSQSEKLPQFDRLDVWEFVDRPLCKNVISMKWLWKNKRDEENTVIRNKSRLVAKGYAQKEGVDFEESFALHLDANLSGTPVDQTKYRSMVGALMYLTASRPDIMHATCFCARYQAKPTEKHFTVVKRIFRYLKDTIHIGLWYPKDIGFELTAFLDLDHAGCLNLRKSTYGGIQFLSGDKLVSWSSKKQNCTSMSSAEVEYVSLSAYCAQVLWMRTQLTDYHFRFDKIPMYCDSKAAIAISCNPVQHSHTEHIDVKYHFIKEKVEKGIVE
nr:uncharacterized mitochondrial protein AtMg00810-like [Tanacetum cinerariifolium]